MSNSKGRSFWGVYAENDDHGSNWIVGYEQYPITDEQWDDWHTEFELTLDDGEYVSGNFDQLCDFMTTKAIAGEEIQDPFANLLEEL